MAPKLKKKQRKPEELSEAYIAVLAQKKDAVKHSHHAELEKRSMGGKN